MAEAMGAIEVVFDGDEEFCAGDEHVFGGSVYVLSWNDLACGGCIAGNAVAFSCGEAGLEVETAINVCNLIEPAHPLFGA